MCVILLTWAESHRLTQAYDTLTVPGLSQEGLLSIALRCLSHPMCICASVLRTWMRTSTHVKRWRGCPVRSTQGWQKLIPPHKGPMTLNTHTHRRQSRARQAAVSSLTPVYMRTPVKGRLRQHRAGCKHACTRVHTGDGGRPGARAGGVCVGVHVKTRLLLSTCRAGVGHGRESQGLRGPTRGWCKKGGCLGLSWGGRAWSRGWSEKDGGGIAPNVVGEGSGGILGWGAYKPSVPPMDDAKTTPSTTQQMMIMIFFLRALLWYFTAFFVSDTARST